jgi:hypothetical protein
VNATSVLPGAGITVTVANAPGNTTTWVGLYPTGAADAGGFVDWKYLNGTQTPPATGMTAATLSFTMPTTLGTYEFRLFAINASTSKIATSATVTVTTSIDPVIQVTPTALAFGSVSVGATSDLTVVVKNTGGGTLSGSASATGAAFSMVGSSSYSLTTNQTATLTVRFAPTAAGAASGTLSLTGGGGASVPLSGTGTPPPTVSVSATTVLPGAAITVTVANAPGNTTTWVGLYPTGAPDAGGFVDWKYLNGTQTPPATGMTSATLSFTMPTTLGTYDFRLFAVNASTSKIATSATVTVATSTNPVIQVTPTALAFGSVGVGATKDLTVVVRNTGGGTLTGNGSVTGAAYSTVGATSYSLVTNQTATLTVRFAPTAAAAASGTLSLTGGAGAAVTLSGTGTPPPTVSASATTIAPGGAITVTVTNAPGDPNSWVGLYLTTTPDAGPIVTWKYLNGLQTPPTTGLTSATLSFTMPTTGGVYDFRLFAQNATTSKIATSATVTVTAPTVSVSATTASPGQVVQVTVTYGPGNARDWVSMSASDAADTVWLDWKYLNGTRTPPATGVTSATISFTLPTTPGTYNFRFFQNDVYTKLATSPTVTVQ